MRGQVERTAVPAENQAILMTPRGSAAIAVVRLVGPAVARFLETHFSARVVERRPVHGRLEDGGLVLDDPVVVMDPEMAGAEVNLHGGPWIVRSFLELAQREGFAVVEAVQPPLPVCSVDGADPLEEEVLAWLPAARTELALEALLAQRDSWACLQRNGPGRDQIRQILEDQALYRLLNPARVVIVGRPNVGKSTLANQLFAENRSITADWPGTTRDWVEDLASIDGVPLYLIDTPGLRESADPLERQAVALALQQIAAADLLLLVLDRSCPPEPERAALLAAYPHALLVLNKCDVGSAWGAEPPGAIRTVATTGQGLDELRREIRRRLGWEPVDPARPRWWTERQRRIIERAGRDPEAIRDLWQRPIS